MYQPPNFQHRQLAYKERYLNWLATKSPTFKLVLGSAILLGVLALCGVFAAVGNATNSVTPTPTTAIQQVSHPTTIPTHAPTHVATSKPTAKPTQVATQKPTPTPVPQFSLDFTLVEAGTVSVHTVPGTALTIKVLYCSGHYATSQSLQGASYADAGGDDIWAWNVETSCHGRAIATVTASWHGQSITKSATFTT